MAYCLQLKFSFADSDNLLNQFALNGLKALKPMEVLEEAARASLNNDLSVIGTYALMYLEGIQAIDAKSRAF